MLLRMKNLYLIGTTDFAQSWFLAQLAVRGQRLAGHLWASKSCCDCVISLLMKKPGDVWSGKGSHCLCAKVVHCVNDLNEKPNHQMASFLFSIYSLIMFAYLLWYFNNPFHVKCGMSKTAYSYCLTSPVIPDIPWGLKWVKWFVCFFEHMLERGSGIKVDTNHLQISLVVCQTRAFLLPAKHI